MAKLLTLMLEAHNYEKAAGGSFGDLMDHKYSFR
jgi:hypothetical protein